MSTGHLETIPFHFYSFNSWVSPNKNMKIWSASDNKRKYMALYMQCLQQRTSAAIFSAWYLKLYRTIKWKSIFSRFQNGLIYLSSINGSRGICIRVQKPGYFLGKCYHTGLKSYFAILSRPLNQKASLTPLWKVNLKPKTPQWKKLWF